MQPRAPMLGMAVCILVFIATLSVPSSPRAAGSPAPVPVTFTSNTNLSIQSFSQGKVAHEPAIVVNPTNPLNLVEGNISEEPGQLSGVDNFSFSTDGGRTWFLGGSVPMENPGDYAIDPALAADAEGNIYYSYLTNVLGSNGTIVSTAVRVARSTDGGLTFPTFSVVTASDASHSPDKDYIAVDRWATSPFRGSIYIVWFDSAGQNRLAVSRDHGATWSNPVGVGLMVDTLRSVQDPLPVVAPDGTVYVFYDVTSRGVGPTTSIQFSKSKDGGKTWSAPADVVSGVVGPDTFMLENSDPHWGSQDLIGIPVHPYPSAAITPGGTLFVAWTDVSHGSCVDIGGFAPPCRNSDVRLSVSRNGGRSWSAPVKLSDDRGAVDQFNPWIAVHPNGLLSLTWEDKRLDPDNVNFDTFYTNTFDGSSFLPNVRVSTQTSLSGKGQTPISDYIGMAASADGIFPVWTDLRSGNADVYVAVGHFGP